ncbi:hypothetical protein [Butyrivibrio sp. INlla16]|uniref:hypothetical protein n=1 Tax=Butyrivibrio sp. INlla16 TaxID=1520807 RepID=UPI00088D46F9|nr:hypothetical protein [Butyrivibrio sp. INlla16]SDB08423.1 hypothetical protein SAMN02910263_00391 [Butyrivibrio sp. INlla16]
MIDVIAFLAMIPFFLGAFYITNKVFSYIWGIEGSKGERKKKGIVHDLRNKNRRHNPY